METAQLQSATLYFDRKQYAECHKILSDIIGNQSVSNDLVIHNELVARYFASGATIYAPGAVLTGFVKLLVEQQKKWEDAKVSDDGDANSYQSYVRQFNQLISLGKYNCAVLYYQSQYYYKAMDILSKFYSPRNLDDLDESLTLKIALLTFDVSFRLRTLDKTITQQSLELLERAAMNANDPNYSLRGVPDPRIILQCVKAQFFCYFSAFKLAKHEIKLLTDILSNGSAVSLLYRAHLEYLEGSCTNAQALLSVFDRHDQPLELLLLYFNNLSCIHLKMGRYATALFYLKQTMAVYSRIMDVTEQNFVKSNPNFNNVRSIEDEDVSLDKRSKSGKTENSTPVASQARLKFLCRKSFSISYGMGLALLYRGKPRYAFQAFQYALQTYYNQPCIWLRLAECCIVDHREIMDKKSLTENESNVHDPFTKKSGKGGNDAKKDGSKQDKKKQIDDEGDEPQISLAYGAICLKNLLRIASVLLDRMQEDLNSLYESEASINNQANTKGPNWIKLQEEKINQLVIMQIAAFANLCWISLRMNDPHVACYYAQEAIAILSGSEISSVVMDKYENVISEYLSEAKNDLKRALIL